MPLFDPYQCHVKIDAKISLVLKHQLIVPSTLLPLATNIPTYKATKIHTPTPLINELFFKIAQEKNYRFKQAKKMKTKTTRETKGRKVSTFYLPIP